MDNASMVMDRLRVMRKQEDTKYITSTEHLNPSRNLKVDIPLYVEWRTQMLAWGRTIASTCKFQKETVEIAFSIADRFVSIRTELLSDSFAYQVACMASLYTAAKINEQHCLTPKQMESLSSKRYTAEDIEAMEQEILTELNWLVNPPTATSFVDHLLELVPPQYIADKKTVREVAESHLHLAVSDVSFLPVKKSLLALASIISAIHSVVGSANLDTYIIAFCKALGYEETQIFHAELSRIRRKLTALVLHSMDLGMALNDGTRTTYKNLGSRDDRPCHHHSKAQFCASEKSPRGVTESHRSIAII